MFLRARESDLASVTAGNGSMMTGPGTNAYLVGTGDWKLLLRLEIPRGVVAGTSGCGR